MSITYLEAIREAQAKALADDPRVFIYGQDVGNFGGAFKATKGLAKEFPGRVLDSPISEDAQIDGAILWPHTWVDRHATLGPLVAGRHCQFGRNVQVSGAALLGDNSIVTDFSRL